MFRKQIGLMILLATTLCVSALAPAAHIVWVSGGTDCDGDGLPQDQGWVDLLEAAGHLVDNRPSPGWSEPDWCCGSSYWAGLDENKIAELEAPEVDLIIISRDIQGVDGNSGDPNDPNDPILWNGITKPVILLQSFVTGTRHHQAGYGWHWLDSWHVTHSPHPRPRMQIEDPGHVLFWELWPDQLNQLDVLSLNTDFPPATSAGKGHLIATMVPTPRHTRHFVWLAEWTDPGQAFHANTQHRPGGHRLFFAAGQPVNDPEPHDPFCGTRGTYNLNVLGEKIFLSAVDYMLGIVPDVNLAHAPLPVDGESLGVNIARKLPLPLRWKPGRDAAEHHLYLSTDLSAVEDRTSIPTVVSESQYLVPTSLELDQTYYWCVDEVNGVHTWPGPVWQFTVHNVMVVDAMENYNRVDHPIIETWTDGVGWDDPAPGDAGNSTGARVDLETETVHGGRQAMSLTYNDTGLGTNHAGTPIKVFHSETRRSFDTPQDWQETGAKALSLWIRGKAGSPVLRKARPPGRSVVRVRISVLRRITSTTYVRIWTASEASKPGSIAWPSPIRTPRPVS